MNQYKIVLSVVVLSIALVGCAAPTATPDAKATETNIAANIFATQTASVPTATSTLVATSTPPPISDLIPPKRQFNHSYEIKTEYDKFKDVTEVALHPIIDDINAKPNNLLVGFQYSGTQFSMPDHIYFYVMTYSKEWQFLSVKEINFLLDDTERMRFDAQHKGTVGSGYVLEDILSSIPTRDFIKMVNAKRVALQVQSSDAELSAEQMEALRDLASRLRP